MHAMEDRGFGPAKLQRGNEEIQDCPWAKRLDGWSNKGGWIAGGLGKEASLAEQVGPESGTTGRMTFVPVRIIDDEISGSG